MAVPTITIFVRHSADCPNKDEFWKKCNCRKHLRWFHNGKLYRQSAKTRSWAQAEAERRKLEARFEAANGESLPIGDTTCHCGTSGDVCGNCIFSRTHLCLGNRLNVERKL